MTLKRLRHTFLQILMMSASAIALPQKSNSYRTPALVQTSPLFRAQGQEYRCVSDASDTESMADLVLPLGYSLEEHSVVTSDGYILGVYRIPHGRVGNSAMLETFGGTSKSRAKATGRPVVLLQHGLLDSSATWALNGPEESLGFILADEGFDVWLGNSRGNTFSKRHKTLSTCSDEFWEFSYDEMASDDLPATINYMLEVTGVEKISYIGHSQGTTIAFAAFSSDRALAARVSVAVMLAPVVFITHTTSPVLEWLADLDTPILFWLMGMKDFMPSKAVDPTMFGHICQDLPHPCRNILTMICGYNSANINGTRWPVYLSYTPAGTSVQNIIHWNQGVKLQNEHLFQMFDFGQHCHTALRRSRNCNQVKYGQNTPPAYNISEMHVPVALFTGGHDTLSDIEDNKLLTDFLPDDIILFRHEEPSYEHLDFTWGLNAHKLIYPQVIQILEEHSQTSKPLGTTR